MKHTKPGTTTLLGNEITLTTLETPELGNRSYIAAADGWAVAVDVPRDVERVEHILDAQGLRLAAVLETHVHNDYVTGGLALAKRCRTRYIVPAGPELRFDASRGREGDSYDIGPFKLRVIGAPGHTDAHLVYSLHEGDEPATAAFTGGSLLYGGNGRTDLLGLDRAEELARSQYWSIRRLARLLPGQAKVLPTHGFGSYCLADVPVSAASDTVAAQLEVNPAFNLDEDAFVARLTGNRRPIPSYFRHMAVRNTVGPTWVSPKEPLLLSLAAVAAWTAAGGQAVDVRSRADYARAHVPGTLSIDSAGALATWTGWTVPLYDALVLVAADRTQLRAAVRELSLIGMDGIVGAYVGPIRPADGGVATTRSAGFRDLVGADRRGDVAAVVDVREEHEWRQGHVRGAIHIPAHRIASGVGRVAVPAGAWIYCAGGFRAAVVASLLAVGGQSSTVIDDAISRARTSGVAWCDGASCAEGRCVAASDREHRSSAVVLEKG